MRNNVIYRLTARSGMWWPHAPAVMAHTRRCNLSGSLLEINKFNWRVKRYLIQLLLLWSSTNKRKHDIRHLRGSVRHRVWHSILWDGDDGGKMCHVIASHLNSNVKLCTICKIRIVSQFAQRLARLAAFGGVRGACVCGATVSMDFHNCILGRLAFNGYHIKWTKHNFNKRSIAFALMIQGSFMDLGTAETKTRKNIRMSRWFWCLAYWLADLYLVSAAKPTRTWYIISHLPLTHSLYLSDMGTNA